MHGWGKERKKKKRKEGKKERQLEAVTQMECGESWGNWQEDRY